METLARRSQTTRTTETTPIVRIELNSIQAIEVVSVVRVVCDRLGSVSIWSSRSFKHFLRRLGRSGRFGRSYGNQAQGRILPGIFEALKAPFFGTVLFGKQSPWGSLSAYSNEMYKAWRSRKLVYYYLVMLYYWSLVVLADEFLNVFKCRLLTSLLPCFLGCLRRARVLAWVRAACFWYHELWSLIVYAKDDLRFHGSVKYFSHAMIGW